METNLIIVDDFYSNPYGVRDFALSQEFSVRGNYPGMRTKSFITEDTKNTIQNILRNAGGLVTNWHIEDGATGSFELATAKDRSWIHSDHFNTWAGVCYLTPNAPITGGTALYKYKKTGAIRASELEAYESQDMTKWERYDTIGNKFNRLALYRSDLFHTSVDYFGSDLRTGRLFQLFFITTDF